jgi:hypothetical protein
VRTAVSERASRAAQEIGPYCLRMGMHFAS